MMRSVEAGCIPLFSREIDPESSVCGCSMQVAIRAWGQDAIAQRCAVAGWSDASPLCHGGSSLDVDGDDDDDDDRDDEVSALGSMSKMLAGDVWEWGDKEGSEVDVRV